MSIYIQKNYGQPSAYLQRYKLRTDGFASLASEYRGGEFTTRPLTFPKLTDKELQDHRSKFAELSRPVMKIASGKLMFGKQAIQFRSPASVRLPETKSLGERFYTCSSPKKCSSRASASVLVLRWWASTK